MSARRALTAVAAVVLLASLAGGCANYDYLQNTDRISYRAGNAVKANLERETINPLDQSRYDTTGLGKNGSLQPSATSTTTTTTSAPPPAPAPAPTPAAPQ